MKEQDKPRLEIVEDKYNELLKKLKTFETINGEYLDTLEEMERWGLESRQIRRREMLNEKRI